MGVARVCARAARAVGRPGWCVDYTSPIDATVQARGAGRNAPRPRPGGPAALSGNSLAATGVSRIILSGMDIIPSSTGARTTVRALRASRIRAVANAAIGRPGVLAFWFGEPDQVTPDFIRDAAAVALREGDTFYTHNLGTPALRDALTAYVGGLHGSIGDDRIAVTNSGMSAIAIVLQALIDPGDRVVVLTPSWPNLVETPKILGARVTEVSLDFDPERGWTLDTDRLIDAIGEDTKLALIGSPGNPTGWTIDPAARDAILARCRHTGCWLLSDDAYERLYYRDDSRAAPSFLDRTDVDERVVSVNTFSKAWCMTGWRLGWIVAPRGLMDDLGKLVEYNTSCAPGFVQHAARVAIEQGEPFVQSGRERLRAARDFLAARLADIPGVRVVPPDGAMYLFFGVDGVGDSLALCKDLIARSGLGLAPGVAFGSSGEGFLRWCFASSHERLGRGVELLRSALEELRR